MVFKIYVFIKEYMKLIYEKSVDFYFIPIYSETVCYSQ